MISEKPLTEEELNLQSQLKLLQIGQKVVAEKSTYTKFSEEEAQQTINSLFQPPITEASPVGPNVIRKPPTEGCRCPLCLKNQYQIKEGASGCGTGGCAWYKGICRDPSCGICEDYYSCSD